MAAMGRERLLILMTDGSSRGNPGPARAGWVLWNRESDRPFAQGSKDLGHATNNEAEWQALIEGLRQAQHYRATKVVAYTDSTLVANQYSGRWRVKHPGLEVLRDEALQLARQIGEVEVVFVYRQILHLADLQARGAGN